jgi:hypothetical protein
MKKSATYTKILHPICTDSEVDIAIVQIVQVLVEEIGASHQMQVTLDQ